MAVELKEYRRIYAIGDIHGRSDLLDRIVVQIQRDLTNVRSEECLTVTLGDYIDRGPDSRGVLDRLSRNPFPTRYIALKGNHEDMLERFLREARTGRHWRQLGGLETLRSYGVPVVPEADSDFDAASKALRVAFPAEHFKFLSLLQLSLDLGRYFFCHAGIRPGVPLEKQTEEDLLWIRDDFLASKLSFGKVVVHGHTPVERPEVLANRINIDTAAFATGRLTCVVLEGANHRFLTT